MGVSSVTVVFSLVSKFNVFIDTLIDMSVNRNLQSILMYDENRSGQYF
jgi:hypothetical protein